MNSISISGNLGKDCETKQVGDNAVCSFSVADSQGRDKPSIWWNCQLWGKRGESLAPYLTKGQQVTVIGNVTQREYADKDGNKRVSMDVRVNDVALMGGKREDAKPATRTAPERHHSPAEDNSDIPF